ncbi:preprotein translocase subunit YajC [Allosaccharopolyspora coralli]|uniref:Preprotein translocase subunit YajC n=1 Tax=Allosaccharopolyspora coralli TaxID=2665642 RepID=A0A5Q3Q593_9PSEU|nr:preprotein translocase subunit YajC [Allosaccharopolyspora coralli]QGK69632.1 preprotein translocase subunit YajC [Allosaccharopolyspora coralli]
MESLIFPLLIALLAVPLFLQARKQKRAMQEQQKLQNSLATGDRVMTTSGLFGTIVGTTDDSIELEIAPNLVTTWVRAAIREKVETESADSVAADSEVDVASDGELTPATEVKSDESQGEVATPIEQQKN